MLSLQQAVCKCVLKLFNGFITLQKWLGYVQFLVRVHGL